MNNDELSPTVRSLIVSGRSREAEERLLKERSEAAHSPHKGRLRLVLDLLVQVYTIQEPRDPIRADQICIEREQLDSSAFSKVQTGMVRYWAVRDYRGAIEKTEAAIAQGRMEHDDTTVYSALSLLGLARTRIIEKDSGATVRDAQLFWDGAAIIEERISTGEGVFRVSGEWVEKYGPKFLTSEDGKHIIIKVLEGRSGRSNKKRGRVMFSSEMVERIKALAHDRIAVCERRDDFYEIVFRNSANDDYVFRAFAYDEEEMLEINAQGLADEGNLWSRPFERAGFSGVEGQFKAFETLLTSLFESNSRSEVVAKRVFVSVGCFLEGHDAAIWVVSHPSTSERGKKLAAMSGKVWRSAPIPAQ